MGILVSFWLSVYSVSELVFDVFQKTWHKFEFNLELKPSISLIFLVQLFKNRRMTLYLWEVVLIKISRLNYASSWSEYKIELFIFISAGTRPDLLLVMEFNHKLALPDYKK